MTDRELMQQALEALVLAQKDAQIAEADYAIAALRERLAQPEQEPVVQEWRYYFSHSGVTGKPDEVVGPCFTDRKEVAFGVGCFDQTALYTPPRREWVGLTEEEVYPLANAHLRYQPESYSVSGIYDLARAIEAKLKEKNA